MKRKKETETQQACIRRTEEGANMGHTLDERYTVRGFAKNFFFKSEMIKVHNATTVAWQIL